MCCTYGACKCVVLAECTVRLDPCGALGKAITAVRGNVLHMYNSYSFTPHMSSACNKLED